MERIPDGKKCIMGRILKHKNKGTGFKLTFNDQKTANRVKDMLRWIMISDNIEVIYELGIYDEYKEDGLENGDML